MKEQKKIIIFDVDNTLIKGHLIVRFLLYLFRRNLKKTWHFFLLARTAGIVCFSKLPHLMRHSLKEQNFSLLDRGVRFYVHHLYKSIYKVFDVLNLFGKDLQTAIDDFLQSLSLKDILFEQGVKTLVHHSKEKNIRIVLMSGMIQELLDGFCEKLKDYVQKNYCVSLQLDGIGGTTRVGKKIKVCIG